MYTQSNHGKYVTNAKFILCEKEKEKKIIPKICIAKTSDYLNKRSQDLMLF